MYGTQRPIFPQNGSIYHFSTCKEYGLNGASSVLLHLIIRGSNDTEENFSELNFIRKNGIFLDHSSTTIYDLGKPKQAIFQRKEL